MHYTDSPSEGWIVAEPSTAKQTICLLCKHLAGVNSSGKIYCKAFPDGIPSRFWDAKADHTTPYDGDNGITFEP